LENARSALGSLLYGRPAHNSPRQVPDLHIIGSGMNIHNNTLLTLNIAYYEDFASNIGECACFIAFIALQCNS
jgi:hypothetical protein